MTRPQEQFTELAHRTQEQFKQLWEQWNKKSTELMKGVGGRTPSAGTGASNPEEVLDAVFDFAENLIEQQRAFAKQMLKAARRMSRSSWNFGGGPMIVRRRSRSHCAPRCHHSRPRHAVRGRRAGSSGGDAR